MDFTKRDPNENLYMLVEGYKHLTSHHAYRASVAELSYWIMLANCNASTIPGQTFEDLFPAEAVAQFRDMEGKHLSELTFEYDRHRASKRCYYEVPTNKGRVEYQLDYVRWYLVPRFAATLTRLFSTLIYTYRNELGGEMGEPPREWVNTCSPLLATAFGQNSAPSEDNVGDAGTTEASAALGTPQERFLQLAAEMNTAEQK